MSDFNQVENEDVQAPVSKGPIKLVIFGAIAAVAMVVYIFFVVFGSRLRH